MSTVSEMKMYGIRESMTTLEGQKTKAETDRENPPLRMILVHLWQIDDIKHMLSRILHQRRGVRRHCPGLEVGVQRSAIRSDPIQQTSRQHPSG